MALFVYLHRGIRVVLPDAVGMQNVGAEIAFTDESGKIVAKVDSADLWTYADHDLSEDSDPEGSEPDGP